MAKIFIHSKNKSAKLSKVHKQIDEQSELYKSRYEKVLSLLLGSLIFNIALITMVIYYTNNKK